MLTDRSCAAPRVKKISRIELQARRTSARLCSPGEPSSPEANPWVMRELLGAMTVFPSLLRNAYREAAIKEFAGCSMPWLEALHETHVFAKGNSHRRLRWLDSPRRLRLLGHA